MGHVGTHGQAMCAPGPFVLPACALPVIRELVWVRPLFLHVYGVSTGDYAKNNLGKKRVQLANMGAYENYTL